MDTKAGTPTVVYVSDPEASPRFSFLSENVEQLLGYPSRHFIEDPQFWVELLHPEDRDRVVGRRGAGSSELTAETEYRLRHADGVYRWIRDSLKTVTDSDGREAQRIGFWTELSADRDTRVTGADVRRMPAPARLWTDAEQIPFVREFANTLPALFFIYDLQSHRHVLVNRAYEDALGYSAEEIQRLGAEFIPRAMHPDDLRRMMSSTGRYDRTDGPEAHEIEYRMKRNVGDYRWMRGRMVVIKRDAAGRAEHLLGVAEDITERKRLEEQLVHTALYDALTDLPNRTLFIDRLERAIRRGKRQPAYRFAVLYMDLDRFKLINDGLGHLAGDQMLVFIARRLESCLREGDTFARLGGDEFALLMDGLGKDSDALLLADRIQNELRKPFLLGMNEVVTSSSIGITFNNPMYENPKEVLRDADIALYRAKEQGLGCYQIFDADMHERMKSQIRLEEDLRRAVDRKEFAVYYQPVRSLKTGQLLGLEALVRWEHPARGLLAPHDFLAAAEESGLIVTLGWWVLREACRMAAGWVKEKVLPEGAYISVNIASKQFAQMDMVERVAATLRETQLPGDRLRLEILETVILDSPAVVGDRIARIRALGVGLLLDDFGTGFSSLSRLVSYPLDGLKIDRSFIGLLSQSEAHRRLVRALIHLAADLNLSVIAEGVQTPEQAELLKKMGCDAVQGLMYLPPMPAHGVRSAVQPD